MWVGSAFVPQFANDDVLAWLAWRGQIEFLRTGFEQEVPSGNQFPVRGSQQRKSMHRTIPVVAQTELTNS
jgi:hypothetical protein